MKLKEILFALAIAVALGAASAPACAQAAGGDVLSREAVLRDRDIPDLGNPQGDLTIVEYFDYQCPYCKKTAPELAQVAREDGKVRIVLKDWPIFGPASAYAAKMALASKFQNKYEDAHDALIAAKTKLTEAAVDDLLAKAGVDVAQATRGPRCACAGNRCAAGPQRCASPGFRLSGNAGIHHRDIPGARLAEHGRVQARHQRREESGRGVEVNAGQIPLTPSSPGSSR